MKDEHCRQRPAHGLRRVALCLSGLAACLPLVTGCGGAQRPEMVPVHGKVTLEGGEWPKPGFLSFSPVEPAPGLPRRPGSAPFDTDGAFTTETGQYEGLIPGKYRVAVICWEREPSDEDLGKSYVPEKYANSSLSDFELTIEPGSGPVEWNRDFPRAGASP